MLRNPEASPRITRLPSVERIPPSQTVSFCASHTISIGTLSAFFATGAPGEISTAPMATLPLLLIPAFLVPFFLMLHTAALMQSRRLVRSRP
jgi:hypothetical protein